MKLNKEELIKLSNTKKFNQTELSKIFHISRQYVSQILNKQEKQLTDGQRYNILKRDLFQCQFGFKCTPFFKQPNLVVHHIDLDHNNENHNNLITLCKDCHVYFHKLLNEDKRKKFKCPTCKRIFTKEYFNRKENLCRQCIKDFWCFKYKLYSCINCHQTKKIHFAKGLCTSCYDRLRYKSNNNYRLKIKEANKKWAKNNPDKKREIQRKASRKYYLKNKEKLLKYQREHYKKLST